MPIVLPAEPWKATGRWELYGDELLPAPGPPRREMLLGPTQEEVVAAARGAASIPRTATCR